MEKLSFLHCADLHVDSPLRCRRSIDPEQDALLAAAPREAFKRLLKLGADNDFLLIAGDLYDGGAGDFNTHLWLCQQLSAYAKPVFIVLGNHDFFLGQRQDVPWPKNVHVFASGKTESLEFTCKGHRIVFHGRSYARRHEWENFARDYPDAETNAINIGLLHGNLAGTVGHDDYAPFKLSDLEPKGYDYWALGHVHQNHCHPLENAWAVYPGVIQGRHIHESGPKGCYQVYLNSTGSFAEPQFIETGLLRWHQLEFNTEKYLNEGQTLAALGDEFKKLRRKDSLHELSAVRVYLKGRAPKGILSSWNNFEQRLREVAAAEEGLYLEGVRQNLTPPFKPQDLRKQENLAGEVQRCLEQWSTQDLENLAKPWLADLEKVGGGLVDKEHWLDSLDLILKQSRDKILQSLLDGRVR